MPYADRQKQLEYKRNWNRNFYLKNKHRERKRIAKRKRSIAEWFSDYKSNCICQLCGEDTSVCLDFHHINGEEKDFNLGLVNSWGWGTERIKREIAKCVVLCANCHRKVHAMLIDLT